MQKYALMSACSRYRYTLCRSWDNTLETITFVGLNPSTADSNKDDPTIRRLIQYAKDWGYGGFIIVNLFGLRATNPLAVLKTNDPDGPENKNWVHYATKNGSMVVCMWGTKGTWFDKDREFTLEFLNKFKGKKLYCFGQNKDGTPKHPLYLSKDIKPKEMNLSLRLID